MSRITTKMPRSLRLVLGDQLSSGLTALADIDPHTDLILMCEVMEETTYVRHHKKKIAFLFSAMRHFAEELRAKGYPVRYITLDDPDNTGSFDGEVARAVTAHGADRVIVTAPGEWRVYEKFKSWSQTLGVPVDIRPDSRFLCTVQQFKGWAEGKRAPRMEYFYREMRKAYGLLMDDGEPTGGQWNYDHDNRKPPKAGMAFPQRLSFKKDRITQDVLALVAARFADHPGDLLPFDMSVTRAQALRELALFIEQGLPVFGDYQDAMVTGEPFLYHSLLSAYLNAGLLLPLEICQQAEAAYRSGAAPLNSVEGFIRQIAGWREFVRGIYWTKMPEYGRRNHFNATRPLPDFYWDAQTEMHCLADSVGQTLQNAYAHHIQRLMITGNFALLAGLHPNAVDAWYLSVYADAYEWVEMPNTRGMALFADGGIMGSKPYAASGNYINRMSTYCKSCRYDPKQATGPDACPFNALYWDFLARHEKDLRGNNRMAFAYKGWDKMAADKKTALREQAKTFLASPAMKSGRYD